MLIFCYAFITCVLWILQLYTSFKRVVTLLSRPAKVKKEDSEEVKSDDDDKESENDTKPKVNASPAGKRNEKMEIVS